MSRYLAIGLGLLALSRSGQDTEVKGARDSLMRKASAVLNITIENRRESPLLEVRIGVTPRSAGKGSMVSTRYFSDTSPNGSVKPHERRVLEFEDLSYEGELAGRDETLRRREERATDYAFAAAVLGQVAGRPAVEIQTFLMEKRAERARQLQASGRTEMLMLIDELIREAKESPDRLLANAKSIQERFERQRQQLVRHVGR